MTVEQTINGGGRNVLLDVFRIALALLIYLFHSNIHLGCTYGFLTDFVRVGNIAMTGFFMLSGYALTLGYGSKVFSTWSDYKTFYFKRFITIYPLYIVTGCIFVLMMICAGKQSVLDNVILLPVEVFGIQAIFPGALFDYAHNAGTWFVSCIILCYILYPVMLQALRNQKFKSGLLTITSSFFMLLYLLVVFDRFDIGDIYTNPFVRLLEFALGVQLALFKSSGNDSVKIVALLFCVLALFVGISALAHGKRLYAVPCFASIIWLCGNIQISTKKNFKWLRYISSITYAFFLVQFFVWNPMKMVVLYVGDLPNFLVVLLTFTACIIGSVIMYELIDKKLRMYLKRKLSV